MFKTTDFIPNCLSLWGVGILGEGSFYILYTLLLAFSKQACPFYLKIFNEYIMKKYTVSRKFNFKFLFLHAVIFKNLLLLFLLLYVST